MTSTSSQRRSVASACQPARRWPTASYLLGGAECFVDNTPEAFRTAAVALIDAAAPFDLATLDREHQRLADRLSRFGACDDARDVWTVEGINDPEAVPVMPTGPFQSLAASVTKVSHDAR